MIEEAFEVATEFRFDVGQAMFNTQALSGEVGKLSSAADGALNSLSYLAGGLVTHLGLGSGGLLSVLTEAVKLSEGFQVGSMGFINSIGSNMNVLKGHINGFNEQLETSKMLMTNVAGVADKLGLGRGELAHMTQLFATPLAQRHKLGRNYSGGIELAKNAMIAGEATGMGGNAIAEALLRGLSPGGAVGGKLFERMVNTQAFHGAGILHPHQLSGMQQDKKMDLLIKSMSELGNNAGYLSERLNSMTTAFNVLKGSINQMLGPIGDALKAPLMIVLKQINTMLLKNGPEIGKNIASIINTFIGDPEKAIVGLMQLRHLQEDMKHSFHFIEISLIFAFLKSIGNGVILTTLINGLKVVGGYILDFAIFVWNVLPVFKILRWVFIGLVEYISSFVAVLAVFQGLSRGSAQAKIADAKAIVDLTPRLTAFMLRLNNAFQNFMTPINLVIQGVADLSEWFFRYTTYVKIGLDIGENLIGIFEWLGKVSYLAMVGLSGFVSVLMGFVMDISKWNNPFKNVMDNFNAGTDTFMTTHPYLNPSDKTSNPVVNNYNHVEARFDMREQLEPDRIAFAVTTHLKNLVMNGTQGKGGGSIHSGLVNRNGQVT
jgi:hypothetical protein